MTNTVELADVQARAQRVKTATDLAQRMNDAIEFIGAHARKAVPISVLATDTDVRLHYHAPTIPSVLPVLIAQAAGVNIHAGRNTNSVHVDFTLSYVTIISVFKLHEGESRDVSHLGMHNIADWIEDHLPKDVS